MTLNPGVRRFEETDGTAFVFGLYLPLPLFDRKQGSIQEAQQKLTNFYFHQIDRNSDYQTNPFKNPSLAVINKIR